MIHILAFQHFQTDTACCDEWFADGVGGFAIPVTDVAKIADRLGQAAQNDDLVERAYEANWQTVIRRLNAVDLKKKAIAYYKQIFQHR